MCDPIVSMVSSGAVERSFCVAPSRTERDGALGKMDKYRSHLLQVGLTWLVVTLLDREFCGGVYVVEGRLLRHPRRFWRLSALIVRLSD